MKNHKLIICLTVIILNLFLTDIVFSQPQAQWVQRYNSPGNYNDYIWDMAIDKSGSVYLTGYILIGEGNNDIVTMKYNSSGVQQWVSYYDGPDHRTDKPSGVAVDDSGNVYVAGLSYSYSTFDDYLIIKYSSNGDSLWVRRFNGAANGSDVASSMTLDKFGDVYVTGYGRITTTSADILTLKYNSEGNLEWFRSYDGPLHGFDNALHITYDKYNNIFVSGRSFGGSENVGVILRYDISGNQTVFAKDTQFFGNKFLIDSSHNLFLGFDAYGGITTRSDIAIAKLDSMGTLSWIRTYHNNSLNNNDYFREMCLDNSGNIIVTGVSANTGQQGWDIATIKYNSNGDTSWIRRYNPPSTTNSNDESFDIASDKFGNVYVTGTSDSGFIARMITIKYSSNGTRAWIAYYNNSNPFNWHSGAKILTDTSGNIYVTGRSLGNGTGVDIVTIKYSTLTNYQNSATSLPIEFKLYQNYPNPFNPKTTISYELPVMSEVSIKISTILGGEIVTLVNENQNAGLHKVEFGGSDLPSGIYFYTLFVDGLIIDAKKLILLK